MTIADRGPYGGGRVRYGTCRWCAALLSIRSLIRVDAEDAWACRSLTACAERYRAWPAGPITPGEVGSGPYRGAEFAAAPLSVAAGWNHA